MAPVISVKADLVTQNENYIYVPLASRTTYGSVMIGEGLNIDGGVLSFDKSEVSILTIAKNGEDIVPDENKRINITIDKTDVGLSEVDNTSDADKPVSTLQQIEFDKKINIYQGKEYSERALVVGEDGYVQPRAISITLDKDVVNKISVGGQDDAVNIGYTTINLKSLVEKSSSVGLPLATDTHAGLMSISDYKSIRELQTRVNRIENRVSKLLYEDNLYPTAEEIDAFVSSLGYTQPYDNIGVLVSGTHHIWYYYDNAGWIDDGIDIVDQFTNTTAGVIKGSSVIGKIYAETDGTGSVNGWDSLVLKLEGLENASDNYVKKQGYQEVTGPIVFVESVGIKNEDGTIDYIKHINNNLLITTSTGTNLLNIDEGLSRVYFFNKEIAFKEDIAESSGTTVRVGGVAVAEFDADTKAEASTVEQLGTDVSSLDASVKSLGENVLKQGVKVKALDGQLTSLATQVAMDYYNKTDADEKFVGKGTLTNTDLQGTIQAGIYLVDLQTCTGLPNNINDEEIYGGLGTLIASEQGRVLITTNGAEVFSKMYFMGYSENDGVFVNWAELPTSKTLEDVVERLDGIAESKVDKGSVNSVKIISAGYYNVWEMDAGIYHLANSSGGSAVIRYDPTDTGLSKSLLTGGVLIVSKYSTNNTTFILLDAQDMRFYNGMSTESGGFIENLVINDSELSTTSVNGIQNKVVTQEINRITQEINNLKTAKPAPDYDKGWFSIAKATTYRFRHDLKTMNFYVLIDIVYDNGTNYFYHQNTLINPDGTASSYAGGIEETSRTTTEIFLSTAKNYAFAQSRAVNDVGTAYTDFTSNEKCWARVRLFKLGGNDLSWK